jgi:Tol biopolymer transport system component
MMDRHKPRDETMTLTAGERLGSYDILENLGAGGMGEVYRARDRRLERDVAIKVLPDELAEDAARMARFEREAKVLASLNHPNIATLYGLEEHGERLLLVMELAAGETLASRMKGGGISIDDALQIARQIAAALETAHEHGIIHRDLKPANVMLSPEGKVKVLDFGLAKAREPADSAAFDLTRSPTLTAQMTADGVLLGTAAYMSPEQARGRPVDRRADVWAFGCILHEMLSGRRLFVGDTVSDVLASVLRSEIDVDAVAAGTPPSVRRLLGRCLQRDPARRLRDLGDAILELDDAGAEQNGAAAVPNRSAITWLGWVAAFAATVGAAALAWHFGRVPSHREAVYAEMAPPAGAEFALQGDRGSPPAIAPNGSAVVFGAIVPGEPVTLWLRSLRTGETRQLAGTEGGFSPFWSPDSRSIGFFDFSSLKRLDLDGGAALTLCAARIARGGVWTPDGEIIFAPEYNTALYRVPATGGEPSPLTELAENRHTSHRWPALAPDGRHLVYLAISHAGDTQADELRILATDGSGDRALVSSSANGAIAAGHLFFIRDLTLMAQPLTGKRDGVSGEPRIVARDVFHDADTWRSVFAVGGDLLVYQSAAAGLNGRLDVLDLDGRQHGAVGGDDIYGDLAVSPDGRFVAVSAGSPPDIWIIEIATGLRTRLTFETNATAPLWSPGGREIYYRQWDADHPSRIMVKSASGAGDGRVVFDDPDLMFMPADISADGRYLVLDEVYYASGSDVWVLDLQEQTPPVKIIARPENQTQPEVSPDGRWIAYSSGEAGALTVYIEPFDPEFMTSGIPRRTGRWQVADSSGVLPTWSSDGAALVYLSFEGRLMWVDVETVGDGLRIGPSRTVGQTSAATSQRSIDLVPGTDRVVVINPAAQTQTPLTAVIGLEQMLTKAER